MDNKVLVPLEQALIPFHESEILAIRLPDGRVAATLNSLCKMLKLARHGQMERIRRDEDLTEYLLLAVVKTPGGSQQMEILIAEAIPSWVIGIQERMVAPEKRALIRSLKIEIVLVLNRHFFSEQATQPPPEPRASLPPPFHDRSGVTRDSPWDRLFEGLDNIQKALRAIRQDEQAKDRRLGVVEEWLTSLDRRVAGTNQGHADKLGWIPLLSAAHLADMPDLFRSLESATGRTQMQLEQEILETFDTPTINAIPDEQWPDVLAWCIWRAQQPH